MAVESIQRLEDAHQKGDSDQAILIERRLRLPTLQLIERSVRDSAQQRLRFFVPDLPRGCDLEERFAGTWAQSLLDMLVSQVGRQVHAESGNWLG